MTKRILLVEDDEDEREILLLALTQAGYEVVAAVAGEQALSYLQLTGVGAAHVDLILLDYGLPDSMDGLEVLRKLKGSAATADIPVIMTSALLNDERIEQLLQAGAALYMAKPCDLALMVKTVGQILDAPGDADGDSAIV